MLKPQPFQLVVVSFLIMFFSAAAASAQPVKSASGPEPVFSRLDPLAGGGRASGAGGGDSLWNGILIGGAAGAVYGLAIAPPQFCGHNDNECATIVKVDVGLPCIAGGAALGALIDYFIGRERTDSATRWHRLNVTPVAGAGLRGVQARFRF